MVRSADRRNRGGPWLVAAVVLFASLWSLTRGAPAEIPVAQDVVRDLLLARQCNTEAGCPETGASTSVPELYQGTLWIRYLALADRLGLGMQAVRGVTLAAAALALALLAWMATIVASPGAGFGAAGLGLLFFACSPELPEMQWNPALLPLPSALLLAGIALAAGRGGAEPGEPEGRNSRPAGYLLAGLSFGLMVQLHPVSVLVLPGLLLLLALRPPKRWPLVVASMAVLGALPLVFSLGAIRGIPAALAAMAGGPAARAPESGEGAGPWWVAVLIVMMAGLAWAAMRRHSGACKDGGARGPLRSDSALVAVLLGAVPAALLLVVAFAAGREIPDRYLVPFMPAGCLLLVVVVERSSRLVSGRFCAVAPAGGAGHAEGGYVEGGYAEGGYVEGYRSSVSEEGVPRPLAHRLAAPLCGRRSGALAGLAVLAAGVGMQTRDSQDVGLPLTFYTFEDARAISEMLMEQGIDSREAAVARLRGPGLFYLHSALSLYLGQTEVASVPETAGEGGRRSCDESARSGGHALRVVKTRTGSGIPDSGTCRDGEEGWRVCLVPIVESLRWGEALVRLSGRGGPGDGQSEGTVDAGTSGTNEGKGPWNRVYLRLSGTYDEPGYPELEGIHDESNWNAMTWRIPVEVAGDGPVLIAAGSVDAAGEVRGRLGPLTGLRHVLSADSGAMLVAAGQKGRAGVLEGTWGFEKPNRFLGRMLPHVVEVDLSTSDGVGQVGAGL